MDFVGLNKLTLVDFDGHISCTLFTEGCNFRCPFCHNASLVESKNKEIPWNEIMSFLRKRVGILDAVVVTGGEPTLMSDLEDKLKDIKSLGFLVKLDSNGSKPEIIKNLVKLKLVDFVAMDIKNSFNKYNEITNSNVDISKIKDTISFLINGNVDYEFRTTIVKEFHTKESILQMGIDLEGAKKLRLQKFVDSGNCIKTNLNEVDKKCAEEFVEILKSHIHDVALRGY